MECGVSPAPDVSRIESSAGQKSPGSTPPSSVKDGAASQPRPISKAGIGQHQIRTPRGASLLSTNSGRGGLARQISSRGTATPVSPNRVQVSRLGIRQGNQNDGRSAAGVRTSDKQRPLASQGRHNDSASTSGTRVSERPLNSPRDTRPSTSTGPTASRIRQTAVRTDGNRPVASLSGGSPISHTSHVSASKTVRPDVKPLLKAATSEGVRLRSRLVSSLNVDRRSQAVSPKLVATPPLQESVEPVHQAGAPSTSAQTSYVAFPQTSCHAAPAVVARVPPQRFAIAANASPSGRGFSGVVPANQPRLQGLSSWPSVWVPQVIPTVPAMPVQVPISMVSRSSMGRHFAHSRSSFATAATAYPSATTHSHARMASLNRWPVAR
ncbi:unnamed protein product [Symbiodinium microadriaticum]|nr:unnamed protein product [Symbiodinium microadriaticum]